MLSSLKKWVQDVAVDLAPPPPSPSRSSISEPAAHYLHTTAPSSNGKQSMSPASHDGVPKSRARIVSIPSPTASPVELDLSHLNREEQEHIANVLRRARVVEEHQSPFPSIHFPSTLPSPKFESSLPSSSSSSSSTTTTSGCTNEQMPEYDDEIRYESEQSVGRPESILVPIYHCQICGGSSSEHGRNSTICSQCEENDAGLEQTATPHAPINHRLALEPNRHETVDARVNSMDQHPPPASATTSPSDDTPEQKCADDSQHRSTAEESSRTNHLTEIDENDFFYDEPSPYATAVINNPLTFEQIDEQSTPSYKIDEFTDDEEEEERETDERDHVKILEQTIANLSRHLPSATVDEPVYPPVVDGVHSDLNFDMEIEPVSTEESFVRSYPLGLARPTSMSMHARQGSLSRSSGVRQNLTDFLVQSSSSAAPHHSHDQPLQLSLSTHDKRLLSLSRRKRNLPSVPTTSPPLHLRRAQSECHVRRPAPMPYVTIDDESDLLEIDLNDPVGSINRTSRSKTEWSIIDTNADSRVRPPFDSAPAINGPPLLQQRKKQVRDQTTNTPPMPSSTSSMKSRKKLKKKTSSPSNTSPNPLTPPEKISPPSIIKLQKSTSTEISYPFPVLKLIINASRQDLSNTLGFVITGGHSSRNCMDVIARIDRLDVHHRNYQIMKNTVEEGDEVLEIGGVSLRGKSALFVENLMGKIHDEFEIILRDRHASPSADASSEFSRSSSVITDDNEQRASSMRAPKLSPIQSRTNTMSKSVSLHSCHQPTSDLANKTVDQPSEEKEAPAASTIPPSIEETANLSVPSLQHNLSPHDTAAVNGAESIHSIDQHNSNESDDSDSLSNYFHSSQSHHGSLRPNALSTTSHGRSQSVTPLVHDAVSVLRGSHNPLKSTEKQRSRGSTSIERKSSLAVLSMNFLRKKTKSVDFSSQNKTLVNPLREYDYVGDIELQISHESDREQLIVKIIQAKNLLAKDTNGFSDPFVKVYLLPGREQENKRRIKHVPKTLNPVWNQTVIYGHLHREEVQYKKLEFTLWDYDRFKANDFLGQVTIDLKNPKVIDDKPHWYRLQVLRSREETTNRGSSPRLFKMTSVESSASSTTTLNKNSVHMQSRVQQLK